MVRCGKGCVWGQNISSLSTLLNFKFDISVFGIDFS